MGYTTEFQGGFKLNRDLTHKEWMELIALGSAYSKDLYEEYTDTPETIPNSYLQWGPNDDGTEIIWNGGEKFYNYVHWLRWLVKHYLKPHGLVINGEVNWKGEEFDDMGRILATDNKITTHKIVIEGAVVCPNCDHKFVPKK